VPSPIDSAFIPAVASNIRPILTSDAEVRSAALASGAAIDLRGYTLTANRALAADGQIGNGTVRLSSTATSLRGALPTLLVDNSILTLAGPTSAGNTTITGTLILGEQTFTVGGTLLVQGANAYLNTQNANGRIIVAGDATFDGGNSTGHFNGGTLELHGAIVQRADFSSASFAPGDVTTVLAGIGSQRIDFATPSRRTEQGSYFASMLVNTPVSVVSSTPVYVSGSLNLSQWNTRFSAVAGSDLSGIPAVYYSEGLFPNVLGVPPQTLYVEGSAGVRGTISYNGSATVSGVPGSTSNQDGLTFEGGTTTQLTVQGDLTISGPHTYVQMADGRSKLLVGGNLVFDGGDTRVFGGPIMSAGTLELKGDFTQRATYSASDFQPAAAFITLFSGSSTQHLSFATPVRDAVGSRFGTLTSTNSGGGLSLLSDVYVGGNFTTTTSAGVTSSHRLAVAGQVSTASGSALAIPTLEMWGTNGTIALGGGVPGELVVSGSATLAADLDSRAPLTVSGLLNVSTHAMTVSALSISGIGAFLQMADPAGHLTVFNDARFAGGRNGGSALPSNTGTLELKGNLTIVSTFTGGSGNDGSVLGGFSPGPVLLSGTTPQSIQYVPDHIVTNPPDLYFGSLSGAPGSNVTLSNWRATVGGATNLFGTFSVPAGVVLTVNTLHLYSGSNTVVQGSLFKNGTCTADPGAAYSGFSCP